MDFGGTNNRPAPVGEATSLPRNTTLRNKECSGEFLQISNIFPFNQPLKNRDVAGGMVASPTMSSHKIARQTTIYQLS